MIQLLFSSPLCLFFFFERTDATCYSQTENFINFHFFSSRFTKSTKPASPQLLSVFAAPYGSVPNMNALSKYGFSAAASWHGPGVAGRTCPEARGPCQGLECRRWVGSRSFMIAARVPCPWTPLLLVFPAPGLPCPWTPLLLVSLVHGLLCLWTPLAPRLDPRALPSVLTAASLCWGDGVRSGRWMCTRMHGTSTRGNECAIVLAQAEG